MAIGIDATSSGSGTAGGQTALSWSHVVGASATELLVGLANTTTKTVSSVTYGGVSLTKIGAGATGTIDAELWHLTSPAAGTATITANFSGTCRCAGGAISLTGTNTGSPFGTAATASGSGTPSSVSVTAADVTVDVFGCGNGAAETAAPDASQTQEVLVTSNTGGGVNTAICGMSIKTAGTAMKWSQSGSGSPVSWGAVAVPVNAGSTGGRPASRNIHVLNRAAISRRSRW